MLCCNADLLSYDGFRELLNKSGRNTYTRPFSATEAYIVVFCSWGAPQLNQSCKEYAGSVRKQLHWKKLNSEDPYHWDIKYTHSEAEVRPGLLVQLRLGKSSKQEKGTRAGKWNQHNQWRQQKVWMKSYQIVQIAQILSMAC